MAKKKLLIYFDQGVSSYSAMGCLWRFQKLLKKSMVDVCFVSSHYIKNKDWECDALALVIPGGRSKPYYSSLGNEGNKRITNYVKGGGSYLGICAGAYYASKKTEFELGAPLETMLDGPLDFFQGKAIGPAYGHGQFSYFSLRGARAAGTQWVGLEPLAEENRGFVYYNGGCYFLPEEDTRFTTLVRYTDINTYPNVAIEGKVGQGKVILTGVHFEVNPLLLKAYPFREKQKNLMNELILSEKYQEAALNSILLRLGIPKTCFSFSDACPSKRIDNQENSIQPNKFL